MTAATAVKKATAGRPQVKPPAVPAAASIAPQPSSRRRQVPLTPMRRETAKRIRKLAEQVQESHPDMTVHDHLRDAARVLESGNEEGAQRHLRAAMFALTPQSLMRNGLHTDDHHQAAREVMHGVHRHLLLVKDITDAAAKNHAALRRDSYGDDSTSNPPPKPADPNAGYGPGALAQKPTARQPPGNQALNAPNRSTSGGSDPNAADPDGPQPRGSKQFAHSWDDLARTIEFSARTAQLERTPAPYGRPGGPGLYGVAGNKHSDYYEQLVQAFMTKRGMDKGRASATAWSVLRKWAAGGGGVHPEVQAAAQKALAQEAEASAKAHAHAVSWDDIGADIELATVLEFFNPAQPRLPVGPGGGQFTTGGGGGGSAQGGQAPAKQPPKQTAQQKAAAAAAAQAHAAHVAHVAHVAHQMGVSTNKAELLVSAQDDRQKAAGLIKQRNALLKALQSAAGKVSTGQAGAKTATTAKTKSTAPAKTKSSAAASTKTASTTAKTTTAKSTTAKTSTSAAKKATASTASTAAASPKAGSAAAMKAQIGQLNTQINQLLAQAKQAETQAATMK